jgi:hypothetical protein
MQFEYYLLVCELTKQCVSPQIYNIQRAFILVFYICIFMSDDDPWERPKHVALLTKAINRVILDSITFINIESRNNGMNCNKNS